MTESLTADELVALVKRVFEPTGSDHEMAILLDLPDEKTPDTENWKSRRETAARWWRQLEERKHEIGLQDVHLVLYRNAHGNNADLPESATFFKGDAVPERADDIETFERNFDDILKGHQIIIAPTHFSATAPLKIAARKFGCRAATMPGFTEAMIPALRLDYGKVSSRVNKLKRLLDDATNCRLVFRAEGEDFTLNLDLRHRTAHASSGVFPTPGEAGNLPSGEAYIVPYEGELEGAPSLTKGLIPVQFEDDIVVYRVGENRATEIVSANPASEREAEFLKREPAYGNIAELGLGVLGDFGLEPTGEILLDEKLGLHIAFGRSEHFGGMVGPENFSHPGNVVHIDRVYISKLQPKVEIAEATFTMKSGETKPLMRSGQYVVNF